MYRVHVQGIAGLLILCAHLFHPSTGHAQPVGSDVFSTQGAYDRFAVGNAHRWFDKHTTEARQKSSHCLSILNEAKALQDTALALDEQARQPGIDSRQATALRKQANEQFGVRSQKIRAFIDCFNQANRQKSPQSDRFATGGDSQPRDGGTNQHDKKPSPPPSARKDKGQKQGPGSTPKPGINDQRKPSDVFSTKGDKTPSDDIQTQPGSGEKTPPKIINTNPSGPPPNDVFGTNSEDPSRQNGSSSAEVQNDSDCLPQVDSHVLTVLEAERNETLKTLAGGGYMTDLFMRTLAKLQAAHMHHLTEPNEGLLSRTTRTVKRALDRAPETAVQAGRAVTQYLSNDTAAKHRYLYGQVEMAVRKAEQELKRRLRNPHITLAEIADSFLVGKATGTMCRWTEAQVVRLREKIDKAQDANKRLRAIEDVKPPGSNSCGPQREDCFWRALQNATGDPAYLLRKERPTWEEVFAKLKQHFGGANAKDPLTRRAGDLQIIAEGMPVAVTTDDFAKVINRMPNNSEGMVFIVRDDGSSHVFTVAKFAGQYVFWDDQARSSNMDILFAGAKTLRWFRYK